jgi:DnaK suppressor protein
MSRQTLPTTRGAPAPLSTDQLAALRGMLEQQRAFRLDQLAQLDRPAEHGPLSSTDPEIYRSLVAGARAALRDVHAALWRMDEGSYGSCVSCAAPVGVERLEILPQAARCLACERDARESDWPG